MCGLTGAFTARLGHRGPRQQTSARGAPSADPRRRLVQWYLTPSRRPGDILSLVLVLVLVLALALALVLVLALALALVIGHRASGITSAGTLKACSSNSGANAVQAASGRSRIAASRGEDHQGNPLHRAAAARALQQVDFVDMRQKEDGRVAG